MFTIADGRDRLYQWDSDVKLIINKEIAPGIDEAHFTAKYSRECLTVKVVHTDTESYVMVPNILLQKSYDIIVYAFCCTDKATKHSQEILVMAKPKPADYVYTETEVYSIKIVVDNALEDAKNSGLFDGKDGLDGITPHIGDNGNWWIGDTDTGKPSQGKDYTLTDDDKEEIAGMVDGSVEVVARPGQMIRVTEVDENGKPTVWEPVPFGWTEKSKIAELPLVGEWSGEDVDGDGVADNSMFMVSAPIGLIVDNTYTVKCNGTDYTVTALDLNSLSGGEMPGVFLGNLAGAGGEDTGEPFMVIEIPEELSAEMDGMYGMIQVMGAVESFSIYGENEIHHKIPNKFIDSDWVKKTVASQIATAKSEAIAEFNAILNTHIAETEKEIPLFDLDALVPTDFNYGDEYTTSNADKELFQKIRDAGIVKIRLPDNILLADRYITVYPVVNASILNIAMILSATNSAQRGKELGMIDIYWNYQFMTIKTGKIAVSATI